MTRMDATTPGVDRRCFLGMSASAFGAACLPAVCSPRSRFLPPRAPLFEISLAEWSLHKTLFTKALDNLDFPKTAKSFGIAAVEYVNTFWKDKARDAKYLAELKKRCEGEGTKSLLIMCDGEGDLGDPDDQKRTAAIENHHKWVEAAKALGCHSIRVNAQSKGSYEEQQKLAADGLHRLCEYGDKHAIAVIVENHGGLSSNGKWLSETLALAKHPRCGSLPDFGNFRVSDKEEYDRYLGIDQLMPFARGVSAKSHDFDEQGNETHTDYARMLEIVVGKHAWRGHIGIEYEGSKLSEDDGIRATKKLLERVREAMQAKLDEQAKAAGKDGK
ncbi:MAG TPA: sugar phosphate isomerase/epimerase family protein [Planctomycetota bacterium]|nr:sugar phosphate isomerase/epimerase family protein [Planctomycetota bacterium]